MIVQVILRQQNLEYFTSEREFVMKDDYQIQEFGNDIDTLGLECGDRNFVTLLSHQYHLVN